MSYTRRLQNSLPRGEEFSSLCPADIECGNRIRVSTRGWIMKKLLLGAAVALALSAGGAKAAVWYDLNVDHCGSGCGLTNYGSIKVEDLGTNSLQITIDLVDNVIFNQAGGGPSGHDEIWFNTDTSTVTIGGLSG